MINVEPQKDITVLFKLTGLFIITQNKNESYTYESFSYDISFQQQNMIITEKSIYSLSLIIHIILKNPIKVISTKSEVISYIS